ncbi:MAG TPA: hypothetical protein DIW52_05670 [Pseudomonas sp.]|jgi:hypothetical protein|nr:hypothetical protein [Pseudomonas sp.]
MHQRAEFLQKAFDTLQEYEQASKVIGYMISMRTGLDAAVVRQRDALTLWSALPRQYADFHPA